MVQTQNLTMKQIGAALFRRDRPRVRAQSHAAGKCEHGWWRPLDRRHGRQILLAAKKTELAGRQGGKPSGPIGHIGLEVLELLINLADPRTGRLEPSLSWLMTRLKRSRAAIVAAMARLKELGFLDWKRRFTPVETEGAGPRIRQVSNAYRVLLPARARAFLARDPGIPEDIQAPRFDLESLSTEDLIAATIQDSALERALAFMARARVHRTDRSNILSLSNGSGVDVMA